MRLSLAAFSICSLWAVSFSSPVFGDSVIAFFDFNNGFDVDDEVPQITHSATIGSGVLFQQRADTDGNGKGGQSYENLAMNINAMDGRSMAWDDISKSGDNDAEFFLETSTLGFSDIQIRFDIRGNDDLNGDDEPTTPVRYDFKFDPNMLVDVVNPGAVVGTIKDFENGTSTDVFNNLSIATNGDTFITEVIDLSSFTDVNNQASIGFRWDDFDGNNAMRIDNVLITGVAAVPEPTSLTALAALSIIGLHQRRRRSRSKKTAQI